MKKKALSLLLVSCMLFSLTACDRKKLTTEEATTREVTTTEEVTTEEEVAEVECKVEEWRPFQDGYAWAAFSHNEVSSCGLVDSDMHVVFEANDQLNKGNVFRFANIASGKTAYIYKSADETDIYKKSTGFRVISTDGEELSEVEGEIYGIHILDNGNIFYLEYVHGDISNPDRLVAKEIDGNGQLVNEVTVIDDDATLEYVTLHDSEYIIEIAPGIYYYEQVAIVDMNSNTATVMNAVSDVGVDVDLFGNVIINSYNSIADARQLDFASCNKLDDFKALLAENENVKDRRLLHSYILDNGTIFMAYQNDEIGEGTFCDELPFGMPDLGDGTVIESIIPSKNAEYYAFVVLGVDNNYYTVVYNKAGEQLYEPVALPSTDGNIPLYLTDDGDFVYAEDYDSLLGCISHEGKTYSLTNGDDMSFINGQYNAYVTHTGWLSGGFYSVPLEKGLICKLDGTKISTVKVKEKATNNSTGGTSDNQGSASTTDFSGYYLTGINGVGGGEMKITDNGDGTYKVYASVYQMGTFEGTGTVNAAGELELKGNAQGVIKAQGSDLILTYTADAGPICAGDTHTFHKQ